MDPDFRPAGPAPCQPAFLTVKYLGAAYLLWLGLHAIWSAARREPDLPGDAGEPARRWGALACYRRGLLSDLGNPKMAVFFTSLLPQFGARFVVLALLGLVWRQQPGLCQPTGYVASSVVVRSADAFARHAES